MLRLVRNLTTAFKSIKPLDRSARSGVLLALPTIFWLFVFFLLPLLSVLIFSFMSRGGGGVPIFPITLSNYADAFDPDKYLGVLIRSIRIAFISTVFCLIIGYPLAFFIATRQKEWVRNLSLFMVILPFWTNFLVRTYAWRIILGQEGIINSILVNFGFEPAALLNTEFAVILGIIYGFLPFMVLPIYASVERFNFRLVEAAHDLGANDWSAFWRVVFPITLPGVFAGVALVFIPAVGAYVTPVLLGGTSGQMIGNFIASSYVNHIPRGAALSVVLMGVVMLSLAAYVFFTRQESKISE